MHISSYLYLISSGSIIPGTEQLCDGHHGEANNSTHVRGFAPSKHFISGSTHVILVSFEQRYSFILVDDICKAHNKQIMLNVLQTRLATRWKCK
jgi:hypothetical protein